MQERQIQLQRVRKHERIMQKAHNILSMDKIPPELLTKLKKMIQKLETYYESDEWKLDFEADESGILPKNMKRGILSEDGLYNLFENYHSRNLE